MKSLPKTLLLPVTFALLLPCLGVPVQAATYILPPPGVDVVGQERIVHARHEDTLMDIAREYGLGLDEVLIANPDVDPWIPGEGTAVRLPTRHILPNVERRGIVLNLAEKRLYYFPEPRANEPPVVMTYPIGVGRMDWETPLGQTRIIAKVRGPAWYPPQSIKQEHLELYGEVLPDVVPAGPDNPLGPLAMRLNIPGYLIHGTNKRDGVGARVSHGCVRMYNEHITELFPLVPEGAPVNIINQPVKVGLAAGSVVMQAYGVGVDAWEYERAPNEATFDAALQALERKAGGHLLAAVDLAAVERALERADGRVMPISR
jgi:L,D-transpeptidase ErfK/SrfK